MTEKKHSNATPEIMNIIKDYYYHCKMMDSYKAALMEFIKPELKEAALVMMENIEAMQDAEEQERAELAKAGLSNQEILSLMAKYSESVKR